MDWKDRSEEERRDDTRSALIVGITLALLALVGVTIAVIDVLG